MVQLDEIHANPDLSWTSHTREALSHWGLEHAAVKRLSLSENATYLVESPFDSDEEGSRRFVLRLHRPGYREKELIESELAWIDALADEGAVRVARAYPTSQGDKICSFINPDGAVQHAVLFEFLEGKEPAEGGLASSMERIGRVAASLHASSLSWHRPEWFKRIVWDEDRIVGSKSDFGDWRNTPEVTPELKEILEAAERKMLREMAEYGKSAENFGLIHTDLRSSNLLIGEDGAVKVIDFDDCGEGWFLFDMACSFSFEESSPDIEDMVLAYLRGYRSAGGAVPDSELIYLPAMLIARRLMLVAWVEKRKETTWAGQIRGHYVAESREIALAYLHDEYLPRVLKEARGAGSLSNVA